MMVTLVSSSKGVNFVVEKDIALMSTLVASMLEGNEDDGVEVPLPNVSGEILEQVLEFLKYIKENPLNEIDKPLKSSIMSENVNDPWFATFTDKDQSIIFELILAANYLDIQPLLDLCCAKVASLIKGKTPEEIRRTFNIVNDFTPEEEAQLLEENKWCEDS
jgi:S-phase kinase-associated protein 1